MITNLNLPYSQQAPSARWSRLRAWARGAALPVAQPGRGTFLISLGVNGSITVEYVPLHPDLAKALKELYDDRIPAPTDPVLVNRYNKPWRSWRTAFENARERVGISDFHFQDLRHCYGSWLAKNGTDIKARMDLMRHKTPSMTMRYSHLSVEYKRSAVAKLPSFSGLGIELHQSSQQSEEEKVVAFTK